MSRDAILFYDGTCGLCARSLQFVLAHEGANRTLRFARLEGAVGREILGARPELARVDSVVWHEPDRTVARSDATIAALRYLGGAWAVFGALLAVVPRFMRDAAYDFVARHRHKIAGRDVCVIPAADQRARFLDPD